VRDRIVPSGVPAANVSVGSFASIPACPRDVRLGDNLGNAGCLVLPVEGIGLDLAQAPKPEPRIMQYELTDLEWAASWPFLPNKPRGIPRVHDRRVLNGIFGSCAKMLPGAP